jgi:hypothetical protein
MRVAITMRGGSKKCRLNPFTIAAHGAPKQGGVL